MGEISLDLRRRSDRVQITTAIRKGWNIPPDTRAAILAQLTTLLSESARESRPSPFSEGGLPPAPPGGDRALSARDVVGLARLAVAMQQDNHHTFEGPRTVLTHALPIQRRRSRRQQRPPMGGE